MDENTRKIALIAVIVLIAGAIFFLKEPTGPSPPAGEIPTTGLEGKTSPYPKAPEITGIHAWLNSEPLTIEALKGKVVLVDFWTYSCINCIRTIPYLRQWNEKYRDLGLVIIGVHSPEFNFEKEKGNVQKAIEQFEVTWPVAMDNDMQTWRNYHNRFWPAKYLIDSQGRIRYTHFGEGAYEETEKQIQALLEEAMGANIEVETVKDPSTSGTAGGLFRTPELYAGYAYGNYLGNTEGYKPEQIVGYSDTQTHEDRKIYLQGEWFNSAEFVRHARKTETPEDYIAIKYLAAEVNAVLGKGNEPYKVFVSLDGKKLAERYAGKDILFDEEQNAFIEVTQDKLYNIINGPLGIRELKLSSDSDSFSLYTFTFGG